MVRYSGRQKSKETGFVTPNSKLVGSRRRPPARGRTAPARQPRQPRPVTAPQVGTKLTDAVHGDKPVTPMYKSGGKAKTGMNINDVLGNPVVQTTLRVLTKELLKTMVGDGGTATFLPRAHGPNDDDAGTLASYACGGTQSVAGRDIKRYAAGKKISAIYDANMKAAAKLYDNQAVITSVMGETFRYQQHYECGFNCKGYVEPVSQFRVLDSLEGVNPTPAIARGVDNNANNYTMFFQTEDYYNTIAQSVGILPPLDLSGISDSGNTDLFFAIRSLKLEVDIMNSNAYYPVQVKVYVLKAKSDLNANFPPVRAMTGSSVVSQGNDTVDYRYLKYINSTTLQNTITGDEDKEYTYTSEFSVLPQVTAAMSQRFKQNYDIVSVDTVTLDPLDTLYYVLEKQIPHATSYREVNRYRTNSVAVKSGDYGLMIEFQGSIGIANPNECKSTTYNKSQTKINNPIVGTVPSRIRVDTKMSSVITAPALDSTLNNTEALSTSQVTWIKQRNFAPDIDTQLVTFPYSSLEPGAATPATSKYTLPVYTDETLASGGGITGS